MVHSVIRFQLVITDADNLSGLMGSLCGEIKSICLVGILVTTAESGMGVNRRVWERTRTYCAGTGQEYKYKAFCANFNLNGTDSNLVIK